MSKKLLVISASPRRGGNSDALCDEFIKGAKEAGNNVEKIFLKDKKINYCTGCGYCSSHGQSGCSQKDDMTEILDKMIDADAIVMATPVYFYAMNGQMKTFIDRVCAKYTSVSNKDFYFIATAADSSKRAIDVVLEEFRGFTRCLNGANEKGVCYGVGAWNIGDINKTKVMSEAYVMGKAV